MQDVIRLCTLAGIFQTLIAKKIKKSPKNNERVGCNKINQQQNID